jgi:hypothetical protein
MLVTLTLLGELASLYAASNDPYSSWSDSPVPVGSVAVFLLLTLSFLTAAWAVWKRRYGLAAILATSGGLLATLAVVALLFQGLNYYVECSVLGACPNWRNYTVVGAILGTCAAMSLAATGGTLIARRRR